MKILYIGAFDEAGKSTNNSQYNALKRLGHKVLQYNYPVIEKSVGKGNCDAGLIKTVSDGNFDLVLISKGSMNNNVVVQMLQHSQVGLWYMDPLVHTSFSKEVQERCKIVDFVCCDKINVLEKCVELNKNSFHVFEGFDADVDYPFDCEKQFDVSMIGDPYGYRIPFLRSANYPVAIIQGAYSRAHAEVVGKTKINLNFVTEGGASDRVYKILAAGGFLLTNDWIGREDVFEDGKDLVIFDTPQDLRDKIDFYLKNHEKRNMIAKAGYKTVQKYNRDQWAKDIVKISQRLKNEK